jgi:hypothetical protein
LDADRGLQDKIDVIVGDSKTVVHLLMFIQGDGWESSELESTTSKAFFVAASVGSKRILNLALTAVRERESGQRGNESRPEQRRVTFKDSRTSQTVMMAVTIISQRLGGIPNALQERQRMVPWPTVSEWNCKKEKEI